jgi:hypothetical protein
MELLHGYCLDRAHLAANPAALAVVHIYLNRYRFLNNGLRTIHPAYKARWFILSSRSAFAIIYYRSKDAPLAGLTGFADGR